MKVVRKRVRPNKRGITILCDSRETRPIKFPRIDPIVAIERCKLDAGDYQALFPDGSMSSVVFERKSIADLWGTMTKGHNRFMAEHDRAVRADLDLVLIVEAPFSRILAGFERSRYPGEVMMKKLGTLHHKYELRLVFCQSREDMSNYMAWAFVSEYLHKTRKK